MNLMKTKIILSCALSLMFFASYGQTGQPVSLQTKTGNIEGTLLVPKTDTQVPVALLIAGSGPTDRNGNSAMTQNNALKMIADSLYAHGIASLRYDKRGIGESKAAGPSEINLRFGNYVDDAIGWVEFLKKKKMFSSIIVVGHSEGSLIGMIAAQNKDVNKFVSLEGAGEPANVVIHDQLKAQPPYIMQLCYPILDSLALGKTVDSVPKMLYALFRPSVQPYLISWFHYNPQTEIQKLRIPVLIVQGTTDIQVGLEDARNLAKADPNAKLVIIKGMNHILKNAPTDRTKNIQTYNQPDLPLNEQFVKALVNFIEDPGHYRTTDRFYINKKPLIQIRGFLFMS